MKTIVYVDGFNLYYGCLKQPEQRHLRWLDLQALCNKLCHENNPQSDVTTIKYFTAPVSSRLSPRGDESNKDQQNYWLAIEAYCSKLKLVKGTFYIAAGELHERVDGQPIDFNKQKLRIWRPEEKQTHVNIALHMLADAIDGLCDQQVLVSNDSDCVPILKTIRDRCPSMQLGVITPILNLPKGSISRRQSRSLTEIANWSRKHINIQELSDNQLPDRVMVVKKKTKYRTRPNYWKTPITVQSGH